MLIDQAMPDFDATRREHRVIAGTPDGLYPLALEADFIDAVRTALAVRVLFAIRAFFERIVRTFRPSAQGPPPEPDALRLADMGERGDWVKLAADPPHEIAFGAVGRFWGGETAWETIESSEFPGFRRPGFARIACNLSFRDYGRGRTLVSYEARTQATDDASRRAFLRYWRVVSPFVGVVMRSTLKVIEANSKSKQRS